MISVHFEPGILELNEPVDVELVLTNRGETPLFRVFLAITLPSPVSLLQGQRRIQVARLDPGEEHREPLRVRGTEIGQFNLTSTNFSYWGSAGGQRITDLAVPLDVDEVKKPAEVPGASLTHADSPAHKGTLSESGRNPARLFISYSRQDEKFARLFRQALRQDGYLPWLDVVNIPVGVNWSTAIQEALVHCDAMLLLVSSASMNSPNVENEWQYFIDEGKPIFPVLLSPTQMHFQIRRLQYINFHQRPFEDGLSELLLHLRQLIR